MDIMMKPVLKKIEDLQSRQQQQAAEMTSLRRHVNSKNSNTMIVTDILKKVQDLRSNQQKQAVELANALRHLQMLSGRLESLVDELDMMRRQRSPARRSPAPAPARARRQTINYRARAREALSLASTQGIVIRDNTRKKFQQYLAFSPTNFTQANKSRIRSLWSRATTTRRK
jgi:septal ring factor EnvC (AmiA/AmiB activator)